MKITVFTPTYNRGYIIENLYRSLQRQSFTDFEWVVVDDGSSDNTEELFEKWSKEDNNFEIRYYKKENGGKHRAINYGVSKAQGEWIFIVDSDDSITFNAIQRIYTWINLLDCKNIVAVSGLRGKNSTIPMGDTLCFGDKYYIDINNLKRDKLNLNYDMAEVYRLDILKRYNFPEYDGEKFITESVVWDKIAYDGYKIRFFNEIIYICDYLDDGLTKQGRDIFVNNPNGYAHYIKQQIQFKNLSIKQRWLTYYNFYLDMKVKYTKKEIAIYLSIDSKLLSMIIFIIEYNHKLKTIWK